MKRWILSGDVLELADDTKKHPVQAEQIYTSILNKTPIWPDLAAGKSGDAKTLQFSRYPVDMMAVVTTDDNGLPIVEFEARTQRAECFPVSRKAVRHGHVVHKNTWYPVSPDETVSLNELLEKAECDPISSRPRTLSGFLLLKAEAVRGRFVNDKLPNDALIRLIFEYEDKENPEGITAQLYPYQKDGWRWLRFIMREKLGGLLADEMGLGKTLQLISALRDPGEGFADGGALVIAPGSLLENWIREIDKFCPGFRTLKHHGGIRTGRPSELTGFDVVVSSYDTVVRDLSLLKMIKWNVVILDEAQNIRNPEALRSKSVKQIDRNVGLAVTGTPVENRLRDLWSIFDFVVPGYLGDLNEFEERFGENTDAAAELEPLVSPLILRRLISEVATDLPERIDIPEILEMSEREAYAYDNLRRKIINQYGANTASLVSLIKLRQFCTHPNILGNECNFAAINFTKFERLKGLLEEIFSSGEKALVFTSFTQMADLITRMAANDLNAWSATLDGRREINERQSLIDQFTAYRGPATLVLNPRAGGAGLNITAANHVIHYNPEWNPALEDQASARAHRIGQDQPVTIRRLIYNQTVEEAIDQRLQRKRKIAETAIIGVEGEEQDFADILAALEFSPSRMDTSKV